MNDESSEITVNQILKLKNFLNISRHSKDPQHQIDEALKKSSFYVSLTKNHAESNIPECFHRLYPSLNYERLEKRKMDPNFIYETLRVCSQCYEMFRFSLTLMKNAKKSMRSQRGSGEEHLNVIRNIPTIPCIPKS